MKIKLIALCLIFLSTSLIAGEPWDSAHSPTKSVKLMLGKTVKKAKLKVDEEDVAGGFGGLYITEDRPVTLVLRNLHARHVIIKVSDEIVPSRFKLLSKEFKDKMTMVKRVITVGDESCVDYVFDFDMDCRRTVSGGASGGRVVCSAIDFARPTDSVGDPAVIIVIHPQTTVKFAYDHCHGLAIASHIADFPQRMRENSRLLGYLGVGERLEMQDEHD